MLDWLNRVPNKTEEELEYDRLAETYEQKFGEPWFEKVGFNKSMQETIEEMKTCIKENKKRELPEYEEGLDY